MRQFASLSIASLTLLVLSACGGSDGGAAGTVAPTGSVTFAPFGPGSVVEGGAAVVLLVELTEPLAQDVAFELIVGGTIEDGDVSVTPSQFTLTAGTLQAPLEIVANDDAVFEGDELLLLQLQQTAGPPLDLGTPTLELDVLDDELPPTLSFSTDASSVSEAEASHTVLVNLSGPAEDVVAFGLDLAGSATLGLDYSIDTSSLAFAPLELSLSLQISPVDDGVHEGAETIALTLETPAGAVLGDPATHMVTLFGTPLASGLAFTAARLDGSRPLLVTDSDGSAATDLTGFIGSSNDARDLLPSGNGAQIAIRGTVDGADGIFVVSNAGGTPVRVSPIPTGFHLFEGDFAWSFDDQYLAFRINLLGSIALYTVRADGEDLTELVVPVNGQIVPRFAWSPASNNIAWNQGFQQGPAIVSRSLWTARADGLETLQRSGPAGFVGVEDDFLWTPDGRRLYYRADNDSALRIDVFQVQLKGAGETLMTPFSAGNAFELLQRPDSNDLAFLGRYLDNQVQELFLIEANGVAPLKLSDPAVTDSVAAAVWAPDGSRIAFTGGAAGSSLYSLQSVLPDASDLQEVDAAAFGPAGFAWAPDSSALAYRVLNAVLRSGPDGSDPTSIAVGEFEEHLQWSPDSTRIAATETFDPPRLPRLVSMESATGGLTVVQQDIELEAFPGAPQWSPDSIFLAYVQDLGGVQELYVSSALTDDDGVVVSGPGLASNGFWDFLWLD